jgi:hypothetical protein
MSDEGMELSARLLSALKAACERYETGEVALEDLQQDVEPIVSALEGAADKRTMNGLRNFAAQLEYIRFMYESSEHQQEVEKEIRLLRDSLEQNQP